MYKKSALLLFLILIPNNSFAQSNSEGVAAEVERNVAAPIGTITASILTPQQYRVATRDCEKLYVNDPYRDCKWMPADGQLAPLNSRFDTFFRKGSERVRVPDLRGVFLRGLNEFDPNADRKVSADRANPDAINADGTPIGAGDFQPFATKRHQHEIGIRAIGGIRHDPGNLQGIDSRPNNLRTSVVGESDSETRPKNVSVYYYVRIN